jgi:hypothetical protein
MMHVVRFGIVDCQVGPAIPAAAAAAAATVLTTIGRGSCFPWQWYGNGNVVARVVDARQNPSQGQKYEGSHAVQWKTQLGGPEPHGPQMIVLAQHKFHGVDIDGIHVGATGRFLNVMMLVNEWIHGLKVQNPM